MKAKMKKIALSLVLIVGLAYAANELFFHFSWGVTPNYTYRYEVNVGTADTDVGDLLPGDSFTINPTISSQSTADTYLFFRIDCESIDGKPIYSFTPTGENASDWTVVEDGSVPGVLVVYGDASTCTVFEPDEKIVLKGKVTLNVTNKEYAALGSAEKLKATFNVCGVHAGKMGEAEATGSSPAAAYGEHLARGGS